MAALLGRAHVWGILLLANKTSGARIGLASSVSPSLGAVATNDEVLDVEGVAALSGGLGALPHAPGLTLDDRTSALLGEVQLGLPGGACLSRSDRGGLQFLRLVLQRGPGHGATHAQPEYGRGTAYRRCCFLQDGGLLRYC